MGVTRITQVYLLASDYQLSEIKWRTFVKDDIEGESNEQKDWFYICDSDCKKYVDSEIAYNMIKQYCYTLSFSDELSCLEDLRDYLLKHMKTNSQIDIWSIWLGGDISMNYTIMPKLNNLPLNDILAIYDEMDYFSEYYFRPTIRKTTINSLNEEDIRFISDNTGVCLIISN